jgi:hypothetical protein
VPEVANRIPIENKVESRADLNQMTRLARLENNRSVGRLLLQNILFLSSRRPLDIQLNVL